MGLYRLNRRRRLAATVKPLMAFESPGITGRFIYPDHIT